MDEPGMHPVACGQNWSFHEGELDRDDVAALLALHFTEMRGGSPPSACHVLDLDSLRSPTIRFFSLREERRLLGVGALRSIEPGHGEIKSMRTAADALGRGVGSAMLAHLVATAKEMGMARLSLETGNSPLFDAANRLYLRDGFAVCGPFADYRPTDFTTFYTRRLD
ncbi:GNAT family N-acetyltransferase [Sphingomonas sp. LY29]|uniref:GNAT family N-acetyltransferase n=1 Tax=Sphingomonas sp. LY29 TaxID=3095341 RepID=UPI002D79BEB3|nr:GNAT family N-acetyltransferase [Sphingomonas sp. LY29]WRP25540.1 GNAT family N-acetyltransferase [Sphingomonas sp. LY29]